MLDGFMLMRLLSQMHFVLVLPHWVVLQALLLSGLSSSCLSLLASLVEVLSFGSGIRTVPRLLAYGGFPGRGRGRTRCFLRPGPKSVVERHWAPDGGGKGCLPSFLSGRWVRM